MTSSCWKRVTQWPSPREQWPRLPGKLRALPFHWTTGETLVNMNFTDHPDIHLGFMKLAENLLVSQLGREPSRRYFYGKSSGARLGRLINYKPGFNFDEAGRQIFDGFLLDDAATGLWLPILIRGGKDVCLRQKSRENVL